MSKRVLFICNSSYQLLTTVQLRLTYYEQFDADLIVTNQFSNAQQIGDNAKSTGLFQNVRFIENKKQNFSSRLKETLFDWIQIWRLRSQLGTFDEICFSNISVFTILLTRFFQGYSKINIFEDGFITYSKAFVAMDRASVIARLLLPKGVLGCVHQLFVFSPQLLDWHQDTIHVQPIPTIERDNQSAIQLFNAIFGYQVDVDSYDKRYLFMEESFFADKYPVDDMEIIQALAEKVGKENVMVKLHPRNGVNRFVDMGIKTNKVFSTPWELIVLNQDIQDCTLVTISSSSILQPYLIFGQPIHSIALINTLSERPGNMKGELGDFMVALFAHYPEICSCPNSMTEFIELIS